MQNVGIYIGRSLKKMSSDPKLIPYVLPLIDGCRILDVACGKGKWGYLLNVDFRYTAVGRRLKRQQLELLVGVDIFLPYLKYAKKCGIYDDVILCDVLHLPFRAGAFDVTLAAEVLEHLQKGQGSELMKEIEHVSKTSTIITTPRHPTGILSQGTKDKNVYQKHVSSWSAKEFEAKGYSVMGKSFPFENLLDITASLFPILTGIFPQTPFCFIAKKRLTTKNVA